ncbi:MAG: DUF4364 family protein [Ruminococcus sp.]|nr:DUF4364 family protein [Ruminococcus sp.]MBO5383812.1 DUF4364 family protein [Ruminococcus sp.]MBR6670958.1 DUF4364 family protein [Ruminococcus sp.]
MQEENIYKMAENADTDIKDVYTLNILICYLLYKLDRPVEVEQLYEIAVGSEIISYFFYQDSIDYLLKNDSIRIEKNESGTDCYVLASKGINCAKNLKSYVPKSNREKLILSAMKYFARIKKEKEIKLEYIKLETGGYYMSVRFLDIKADLMELKLFAPDLTQAKLLGNKIMNNPAGFYSKLIELALENTEEEYDMTDI